MDYIIVGSGLTGAVIARLLTDRGARCLILERRTHLGGNVHDHLHPSGIRVHTYGPHYFRTSSLRIWNFVQRFSPFIPFEARVLSWADGAYVPWPPGISLIHQYASVDWKPGFEGLPAQFEEMALSKMPRILYETFVKGYTEKQWGVPAAQLSAELAMRFNIREDNDPRLTPKARFQGLPEYGYARFMENLLDGIPVLTGVDYLQHPGEFTPNKKLIFTGPIDEYFNYRLGRLHYRGQQRTHEWLAETPWFQPGIQVNNPSPQNGPHIRTLEWKHLLPTEQAAGIPGTLITRETPFSPKDPNQYEYPFPDATNQALYRKYRQLAQTHPEALFCGRLGEYRYLDMDQAIARAMTMVGRM